MKRRFLLVLSLCLFLCSAVPAWADTDDSVGNTYDGLRLFDEADLLDDDTEEELSKRLDDMADEYGLDPVILLLDDYKAYADSVSANSPEEFATNYYKMTGYGSDDENSGIILMVSMEERDWHIYIQGEARVAINDYGFEFISERLVSWLSEDDYEEGIIYYVDDLELFFEAYDEGEPYGSDNRLRTWDMIVVYFGGAIIGSVILSLIIVLIMRAGMNTAKPQPYAREYVKKGSFALTNQQDLFLYTNTVRKAIPKSSSSSGGGGSSSGSRGGSGGGGKF